MYETFSEGSCECCEALRTERDALKGEVERLKLQVKLHSDSFDGALMEIEAFSAACTKAEAHRDTLRGALEPFADRWNEFTYNEQGMPLYTTQIEMAHYKAARQALADTAPGGDDDG